MANEIELKLAFPPAARAAILRHPLLANAKRIGRAQTLINTYFDTPEMALSARRVALRTRKAGKLWLQTVKCAAESLGGLSSRPEWEQAFNGSFDFSAIDAPAPRRLLEKHAHRIVPLFTTNFRRETLLLTPREGVRIQVMIDSGEISANGRVEPISELELELETGCADDLLAIASELATSLPLLPYDPSKAARGYALFRNESIKPARPAAPRLDLQAAPLQAFVGAAFQTITAWAANQHAAIESDDPEFVHQLRLSLRRLRSLIRLFTPVLPADFVSHWQAALAAEANSFAEARELSVLCTEVLDAASEGDSDQRLPALRSRAQSAAAAATAAVKARLGAAGAGVVLLSLSRALHALPTQTTQPALADLATQALHAQHKHACRCFAKAKAERSAENLHALRIALKRLRHAAETFAPIFPAKAHERALAELGCRLSELGRLHDLAEALPRLADWASEDPTLREAVAFVAGWHAATSLKLRRRILPRCAELLKQKHWRA
ncbi:hypothetical protein GCM10027046_10550 [Uliginosibacterium flavum]|uniref:CHAD domain-containing protein n=1 Tax=Uliginosibacterium flavum TaxID=1396831 RepID=A0ABV2TR59_9RHOO